MRRGWLIVVLFAATAAGVAAQGPPPPGPRTGRGGRRGFDASRESMPVPKNETEKRIIAAIEEFGRAGEQFQNIPIQDGKMLRLLTEALGAKHVVEIGTSTGHSGLWLCLGLQATGGKLTTFEISAHRASVARENFKRAGVEKIVTQVIGDAHDEVAKLTGPIDAVFIDADKDGYLDYLNKLLPLLRPGGLILAHNIDMVMQEDYGKAITTNPNLETVIYRDGGGLGITLKKR